jgi:hypothetical protein
MALSPFRDDRSAIEPNAFLSSLKGLRICFQWDPSVKNAGPFSGERKTLHLYIILLPASDSAMSFSSRRFRVSSFFALTTHQINVWRYDPG